MSRVSRRKNKKLEGLEWRDQVVQEFAAQHTPIYIIVLQGEGRFPGEGGKAELPAFPRKPLLSTQ